MNRSAYDRFSGKEDPQEPDRSAFYMGQLARRNGGRLEDDPFKPGYWLSDSWRAGWCDEDQAQQSLPHTETQR